MADFKKIKYTNILTPVGIAVWPKLNAPDTKYKAGGEFNVKLKLSDEEAAPIIALYEKELAAHFEAVKAELMAGDGKAKAKAKALKLAADKPYKEEFDEEGDATGSWLVNFKMPNRIAREGKADLVMYPAIFDAAGKALKNPPEIWGGSKLIVSGQLRPFNTNIGVGMSLRLQAVQIIELTSKGERSAAGFGFGAQEGGYEGSDEFPSAEREAADRGDGDAGSDAGAAPGKSDDF